MPVDQLEKRRQLARNLITQSEALMRAVNEGAALASEYASAGLTFVDADFTGSGSEGLVHVDAASMITVITNFATLKAHLETNFIDDVFLKVKR